MPLQGASCCRRSISCRGESTITPSSDLWSLCLLGSHSSTSSQLRPHPTNTLAYIHLRTEAWTRHRSAAPGAAVRGDWHEIAAILEMHSRSAPKKIRKFRADRGSQGLFDPIGRFHHSLPPKKLWLSISLLRTTCLSMP